jgi:cell division protein FtsQ
MEVAGSLPRRETLRGIVSPPLPVSQDEENGGAGSIPRPGILHGLVLPRFLRRPARMLEKMDWQIPHHLGVKSLVGLFLATAVAGVFLGGHGVAVVSAMTAWSGLGITEVKITGQSEASEMDVLDHLEIGQYPSLVTFDVEAAKARVEKLPWVKQATLKKVYPHGLEVAISERDPFAVWQHDGVVSLVDDDGSVISDGVSERYAALPLVVGPGAASRAAEFTNLVGAFPEIAGRVRAGVLVSGRRWNIVLNDGVELLLPEKNPAQALQQIVALDESAALLSREIAAVDMRLADNLVLRLDADGVAAPAAMVKARAKNGGHR